MLPSIAINTPPVARCQALDRRASTNVDCGAVLVNSPPRSGFWDTLPRPMLLLAPMANVTDTAFRQIIARCGRPDLMMTEFTSCEGLCSRGRERLLAELAFHPSERPLVVQFFGPRPEPFYHCAQLARRLGFDGIDINTGCPDRRVLKQGAGAALIGDPGRMREIYAAARDGAGGLPVSIKTRLGIEHDILEEWLGVLLELRPAAITLHARTVRELSNTAAHWDAVARAVRQARGSGVPIIGNGDARDPAHARALAAATGADGVMLGRAIFGNPWLFHPTVTKQQLGLDAVLEVMLEHAALFDRLLGEVRPFVEMRRHFKAYLSGFPGAKGLRVALMETHDLAAARAVVEQFRARPAPRPAPAARALVSAGAS